MNTILNRLEFDHKLITIGPNFHHYGTRVQPKYNAITFWVIHGQVPSARLQKDVMLAADGGHMGPKEGPQIVVCGIRCCQFLIVFPHSILDVI